MAVDSLLERVKLALLYNGNGIVENFKNNSLFFYDKYSKSSKDVKSINIKDIYINNEAKNISVYSYFLFVILYYMWIFLV